MVRGSVARLCALAFVVGWATTVSASAEPMQTGAATSRPVGHYNFCQRFLAECSMEPSRLEPEAGTDELMDLVQRTNIAINRAIKPMSDRDLYGVAEFWAFPSWAGDCEDYVLQKRKVLSESGLSLANLLITVVRKPDGEGHAVLTLRTDAGDLVLDNLTDRVLPWQATGYTFIKRQAIEHTGRWVSIQNGAPAPLVGSVE